MKYRDLLDQCLEMARRGADPEELIAAYPEHAEALRQELAAARHMRQVAQSLPGPGAAPLRRFNADLAAARRDATAPPRTFRLRPYLAPALAASLVAVLIVATATMLMVPGGTAEASIEGVIVENDGTTLTVHTASGIQTVSLTSSGTVSGQQGTALPLANLEPGQLLRARGKPGPPGKLAAQRIELQSVEALPAWCERFADSCSQAERVISQRAESCQRGVPACEHLKERLRALRGGIEASDRLKELRDRCDAGVTGACREVQQFCATGRPACDAIRDWLRERIPPR